MLTRFLVLFHSAMVFAKENSFILVQIWRQIGNTK
jgi:hypothetical protein